MPNANQLFTAGFAGALGAAWPVTWLGTTPASTSIKPRLDGAGRGIGGQVNAQGYTWRGRAEGYPGRSNYKVDLEAAWKNPGGQIDRTVGLMARVVDANNYLVARYASKGAGNPELKLFKRIGGVETQLGSTYSGLGSSTLYAGLRYRVRVEDLASGETRVTVYTGSLGAAGDGTSRIDWTGTLTELRGAYTVGVEVGEYWAGADVAVDNLSVYDFADEATITPPGQGSTGWVVEVDGTLYKVNDDTGQLEGISPAVFLEEVRQGYGPQGNRASLTTAAFTGGIVKPNSQVAVWYGDTCVFRGRVTRGDQSAEASNESTTWQCNDAYFIARQAILTEDDGTGVLTFNVSDEQDDTYRDTRQGKTIGDVLQFLFDRYTTGNNGLRFYGACSPSGTPYVTSDLAAMDAVIPNLAVSSNFAAAVGQLLNYFPKRQLWIDPATLQWRFKDVTALSAETISLTSEWATVRASPDPSNNYTAVLWRGAKEEPKAEQQRYYDFGEGKGTLKPAWTPEQEANYTSDKRHLTSRVVTVLSANNGTGGGPIGTNAYFDFSASEGLDPDDFRGSAVTFSFGGPGQQCLTHTSSRAYFTRAFTTLPTPGSKATFVAVDASGKPTGPPLGARTVGRAFMLPEPQCTSSATGAGAGLLNNGFCGNASVEATGADGSVYSEQMGFTLHVATAEDQDTFPCYTIVETSEIPKPPIGLVNFLPPPSPRPNVGGAVYKPGPPVNYCGELAKFNARLKLSVSEQELVAPAFREPNEGYRGTAYSDNAALWDGGGEPEPNDWGIRQIYTYDDPDFTSSSQITGLRKAAAAMLAVFGQKTYLFDVTLGTPWIAQAPQYASANTVVSRWHGLTKNVSLSSAKRTTTFESAAFPMFEVAWNVRSRTTTVRAGTAAGWLGLDAAALTRELRKAALEKKVDRAVADLAEFQNRFLSKALKMLPQGGAPKPACDVAVVDNVNQRTVSAQEKFDDDQKTVAWLSGELATYAGMLMGENKLVPGDAQGTPGATTGYVIPGNGQALGPPGSTFLAYAGPQTGVPNADTGRYGGIPGVQESGMGAPTLTMRMANVAFRVEKDSVGRVIGIQGAQLTAAGAVPTSGWVTISKPQDVYTLLSKPLIDIPSTESLVGILKRRDDGLAEQLGASVDAEGKPIAPGSGGAKPSIASWLRSGGHSRYFRMVPGSWGDPGGPVWQGPAVDGMVVANSDEWPATYWRVAVPENVLYQVEAASPPGSGTSGGEWSPKAMSGAALRYMSDGYVWHKQVHGRDMEPDQRYTASAGLPLLPRPEEPGNPFGFSADAHRFASMSQPSGLGATIALPKGAVNGARLEAFVTEDAWAGSPDALGATNTIRIDWAWRGSPWGAANTGGGGSVSADGAGTGSGLFMYPGGSVPPNLRLPNPAQGGALAVSVVHTGGTATNPPRLVGIGVDVAVVEGGLWLRCLEGLDVADACVAGNPWSHQPLGIAEAVTLDVIKVLAEGVSITEAFSVELNPPAGGTEALTIGDSVATLIL